MEQTAIELTAAVRARDPEQVDTSIAKLLSLTTTPPTWPPPADTPFDDDTEDTKWCAVADSIQPAMERALKALLELRGPKEECLDAIVGLLASVATNMHFATEDHCIFEGVFEEAARAGSPPDRLIRLMSHSHYAPYVYNYFDVLPGHVYAIELLAWMAGRRDCLGINGHAGVVVELDESYFTAAEFLSSIENRGPEFKAASALVASFASTEVKQLAYLNDIDEDRMPYEIALRSLIAQTGINPRNWDDAEGFATRVRVLIFKFVGKLKILAIHAREKANAPGGVVEARLKLEFESDAKRQRSA